MAKAASPRNLANPVQFKLNISEVLRDKLAASADVAHRSMSAEMVYRLEKSFSDTDNEIINELKMLLYGMKHKDIDANRLALMRTVFHYGREKVVDPMTEGGRPAQEIFDFLYAVTDPDTAGYEIVGISKKK